MTYFTMQHSGGLDEALKTVKPISEGAFNKLKECGLYKHYCYDERIGCTRYILIDIEKNYGLPVWLLECDDYGIFKR